MSEYLIPKDKLIDVMNRPLTMGLFYEASDNKYAVYTLKDFDFKADDGREFLSLKRLYLEEEDPIEYSFVKNHLYNFRQWERMCEAKDLADHITEWRKELDLKLSSSAVQGILEISTDEMASGQLQALRFFAKGEYKDKIKQVGRPKKEVQESSGSRADKDFSMSSEIISLKERLTRVK